MAKEVKSNPADALRAVGWIKSGDRWRFPKGINYVDDKGKSVFLPDGVPATEAEALLILNQQID